MIDKIHIDNLSKRLSDYGPFEWVFPENVLGIDKDKVRNINKEKWFSSKAGIDDLAIENESEDETITDYLLDCLSEQNLGIDENLKTEKSMKIDGITLVKTAIELICGFGSSYAGVLLTTYRELINESNVQECMKLLKNTYEKSMEPFIKDILRDFILDIFEFGPLLNNASGKYYKFLNKDSNDFLKKIYDHGYFTINKDDARYFSNGKKRL